MPATPAWLLDVKYAGKTVHENWRFCGNSLQKKDANAILLSRLDSVAWLLNLRADDIACTPVAMAYCLVLPERATLFIDRSRLPQEAQEALHKEGVETAEYGDVEKKPSLPSARR